MLFNGKPPTFHSWTVKICHFDTSSTVSKAYFFLISPLPWRLYFAKDLQKVAWGCTFLMAAAFLGFMSRSRYNSQLMKYNMLWIISAKCFTCGEFIGMYVHCVSSDEDDNLIAEWLVASPLNTCKLCSCDLSYSWRDIGAESSCFFHSVFFPFFSFLSVRREASLSERLWGSTAQFTVFSLWFAFWVVLRGGRR